MNLTLRKPFYVALEGARGTGKTTLAANLRAIWKDGINTPCVLMDPGPVTPLVEVMRASENQGVLHHQAMVEWYIRERSMLAAGEIVYVYLTTDNPASLASRAQVELTSIERELATYDALLLERAIEAQVLKVNALLDPQEVARVVAQQLSQVAGIPLVGAVPAERK